MATHLTPREIQTRVRHGASPEELSQSSGMDLEKIMVFALPVLAEREHMVNRARAAVVRRRYVPGHLSLDAAIFENVDPLAFDEAIWDSRRGENNKWVISVSINGAEPVEFIFDTESRYVIADSPMASELIGDSLDDTASHLALADAVAVLDDAGVANPRTDSEDFLTAPEPEVHPEGVVSLKAVRDQRAMGELPLAELGFPNFVSGSGSENENDSVRPTQSGSSATDSSVVEPPKKSKKRERRRVPSWDEIMFGEPEK